MNRKTIALGPAFLASLSLSAAAHADDVPAHGVSLGVRTGYGIPLGSAQEGSSLSESISSQIPIWIDAGYRFTPHLYVGAFFQYGFGYVPSDSGCVGTCSRSDIRFGVDAQYHFLPHARIDPWAGIGFGYEILHLKQSADIDLSSTSRGFEFLHVQGGADFKPIPALHVGPFVDFSLDEYSSFSLSPMAEQELSAENGSVFIFQNKTLHEWLLLGVRGQFDL